MNVNCCFDSVARSGILLISCSLMCVSSFASFSVLLVCLGWSVTASLVGSFSECGSHYIGSILVGFLPL